MADYTSTSEALARIPKGQCFEVRKATGGRPLPVEPLDGAESWTHETFERALRDRLLSPDRYILVPLKGGKTTSRRVTLDLSMMEESTATVGTDLVPQEQQILGSAYLQSDVVAALLGTLTDERQEKWALVEKLESKEERIRDLEREVLILTNKVQQAEQTSFLEASLSRLLVSPLGQALGARLAGGDDMMRSVLAAAAAQPKISDGT